MSAELGSERVKAEKERKWLDEKKKQADAENDRSEMHIVLHGGKHVT